MLFDPVKGAVIEELSPHCFLDLRSQRSHQRGHQMAPTDQARLHNHSTDPHNILHLNKHQYTL